MQKDFFFAESVPQCLPSCSAWLLCLNETPKVGFFSVTRVGEISPLWQILQVFGNFSTVDFLFGKILNLLWQPCCNTGPFFNVVND